jgi:hypothetical protein
VTFRPQKVSVTGITCAAGGTWRPAAAAGMSAALPASELRSNAVPSSPSVLRMPRFYGRQPRADKAAIGIELRCSCDLGKLKAASTTKDS